MLKIVGTEDHEIVDEKIILDDNNKLTPFGLKFILIDLALDMCLFYVLSKLFKKKSK